MSELKTENLTVAYKSRKSAVTAIDGLTAVFPSDSFNVIVGYSGCGKTTLLKSVLGLLGYSGHIFFDGEQIDGKDVNKRNFSYVSQEYALYSHLTVFDNIAFPLKVMGADKTETRKRVGDVITVKAGEKATEIVCEIAGVPRKFYMLSSGAVCTLNVGEMYGITTADGFIIDCEAAV